MHCKRPRQPLVSYATIESFVFPTGVNPLPDSMAEAKTSRVEMELLNTKQDLVDYSKATWQSTVQSSVIFLINWDFRRLSLIGIRLKLK